MSRKRRRWTAMVHMGPELIGWDFKLCSGPRWWCRLRIWVHLDAHPYRCAWIAPAAP
jgi:hypothetical protein